MPLTGIGRPSPPALPRAAFRSAVLRMSRNPSASTALDRFRARSRHCLALRAATGERRQAAQYEAGVADRLPADLVERVDHRAGAMGREQQTLDLARWLIARRGLLRKDIRSGPEAAGFDLAQELGKIDHPCPAHQQEDGAWRDHLEFALPQKSLVLAGHGGEHDDDVARPQDLRERGGGDAEACHEMIGHPRIVGLDRAAERLKQGNERAREIAEADQADARPVEREAAFRALEQPFLVSLPHGAIRRGYAAAEVDRHPERHFGNGPRESGARREHMNAALEADLVVDILQKVRLDIDDGAKLWRAVEAGL